MRGLLITLLALTGCLPASAPSLQTAQPLPAIVVQSLDGTRLALPAALHNKPALISLWATWCEACREEFGALERLAAKVGDDAAVIAVAVGEPGDKVRSFVREHALRYDHLVDEDYLLSEALGQSRIPATLVVDRAGRIIFRGGTLDRAALAAFRQVLE